MNEYLVAFDISDPDYYSTAAEELIARPDVKDYGLSYCNLVQLYDRDAVITSVQLNPIDTVPTGVLEQIVDVVHHGLIFSDADGLKDNLAEVLSNYYYSYTVTFESDIEPERFESIADKYGMPVPIAVEEL